MRVTRVVTLASRTGRYGGPFDTAVGQARILRRHGVDVDIVAGYLHGDRPYPKAGSGLRYHLTGVYGPWSLLGPSGVFSLGVVQTLLERIRHSDVVHVSLAREPVPVAAAVIALLFGKRLIAQPHGMITTGRRRLGVFDFIMRPLVRHANCVMALTETEADELREWARDALPNLKIVGNPVTEPVLMDYRQAPSKEALFVARLHPRKNVGHFVAAAKVARRSGWDEKWTVLGPDGGELSLVQAAIATLPILCYEGALQGQAVAARIAQASVFVLTSSREPWGNSVVTAIAEGVPVVVPRSAALADAVLRHGAGAVYTDGDIDELALKTHRLVTDPETRKRAVQGCAAFADQLLSTDLLEDLLLEAYGSRELIEVS